ncbi:hypothetical protein [Paenibacillus oleatilyticus]|uniref:hypothetical protein n=1 Tax=Paenibacillus oleatilyticus TaxID=2594886 RepID=UPI001C1F9D96|nr:hypothetical protein [Paenibacillus oleatilyticus]MBU7319048.1 hypothetical protein [Paenibacillus oleatilyticus]
MTFQEAQEMVLSQLRVRVWEKQWGNIEIDYVRYFDDVEAIESFRKETGFRIEIL